jgi:hypothetical protein
MDDPAVSRRQFFRGLAGDLMKVVGEVAGAVEEPEQEPRVINLTRGDVLVPPEKQEATLNELFGFLEQLGAEKQEEDERTAPPSEHTPAAEAEHTEA